VAIIEDYLDCAGVVRELLASDDVVTRWDAPSVLEMWSVAGLSGHIARSVLLLPGILDAPLDEASPLASAVDYFVTALSEPDLEVTSDMAAMIRDRGLESAGRGPDDLLARYDDVLVGLKTTLPDLGPDHAVAAWGMRLPLSEYLVTRLIEMTVHADDLAVSVGTRTPAFPGAAEEIVVGALAGIAARRRGFTNVLRGLARSERASGRITAF
jgi:hypothetical protein